MKPLLCLLLLLLALPVSAAERLLVRVLEGAGPVAPPEAERVLGAAVELAREVSARTSRWTSASPRHSPAF